jgi:hypothetical protein
MDHFCHTGSTDTNQDADPNPSLHFDADGGSIFHFNADPDPVPHRYDANLRLMVYRPPGSILGFRSFNWERPGLHFYPLKFLNFEFNADPDPAFHSNADPDPASSNNADQDSQP